MASDKKEFFVSLDLKNNSLLNFAVDVASTEPTTGGVAGQLKSYNGKLYISNNEGKYSALGTAQEISTVSSGLEALTARVAEVESTAGSSSTGLSALTTRVTTAEGKIETLQTGLGTAQGDISDLKSDMSTAKVDISTLKTTVGDASGGLVKDVADNAALIANKANAADVYTKTAIDNKIGDINTAIGKKADAATTYTKTEVDTKLTGYRTKEDSYDRETVDSKIATAVSSAYKVKGTVDNDAALPSNAETGDVYNIKAAGAYGPAGTNVVWDGAKWDALGGIVDLSDYATKTYVNGEVATLNSAIGTKVDQDAYNTKVASLESSISSHTTSIQGLRTDVDSKVAQTEYDTKIGSLETSIGTKATKVATGEGTWTGKITVNAEGIVTGGANLVAADIPDITASQISDFKTKARDAVRYQTTSNSGASVTVTHGLGVDFPHVAVYNAAKEEIITHVAIKDANTVIVSGNEDLGSITIVVSA